VEGVCFKLVTTTLPDLEKADELAQELVSNKLAACVQVLPVLKSHYWWEGRVEVCTEVLLLCKTTQDRVVELQQKIQELHPYQVPQIVVMPIEGGLPEYLQWIQDNTREA